MKNKIQEEALRLLKEGLDPLIRYIISEIETEATRAKTSKDSIEETALNVARQEGIIIGAYKVFKLIEEYAGRK